MLVTSGWWLTYRSGTHTASHQQLATSNWKEPGERMRSTLLGAIAALLLSTLLHAGAPAATTVADAAMSHDADAVRGLLKQGGDVNAAQGDGMTALHWAAMHGDATLATTLLYAGGNLRATTRLGGYTPLHLA